MEKILNHSNENFITLIDKFISKNRSPDRNIADQVKSIISDVEKNGDKAISELTLKHDNYNIFENGIFVDKKDIDLAYDNCDKKLISALEKAAERIQNDQMIKMKILQHIRIFWGRICPSQVSRNRKLVIHQRG